jgi:hypothetical protein
MSTRPLPFLLVPGVLAVLLYALSYPHQHRFTFPTAVSRLDLLHAVAQEGSLRIDRWHTNTCD